MADDDPITITVEAQGEGPPTVVRLRKFLKALLRKHGLRCTDYAAGRIARGTQQGVRVEETTRESGQAMETPQRTPQAKRRGRTQRGRDVAA